MDFIKKNMAIIVPAGIAVVAVLLFVPTSIIRGKIRKNLDSSVSQARSIESMIKTTTSARQSEIVKNYQDQHQQDANNISNLAMQSTQRQLLSYKIFPEPNEISQQIFGQFERNYTKAIEDLILKDLGAMDAPTDAEIQQASGSSELSLSKKKGSGREKTDHDAKITALIYKKRAETISVYAHPKVLSGYNFWEDWKYEGTKIATQDCWYCQITYWIHKDVIDTIIAINAGSDSVLTSPVKRLLGVGFQSNDATELSKGGTASLPGYVMELTDGLASVWTGRRCDDDIDISHFSIAVVVRSKDVLRFMQELCSEKQHYFSGYTGDEQRQDYKHKQITILQSDIETIERDSSEHERYLYGDEAVVRLNLVCEYIFNRAGYDKIKPGSIKEQLGQLEKTNTKKRSGYNK